MSKGLSAVQHSDLPPSTHTLITYSCYIDWEWLAQRDENEAKDLEPSDAAVHVTWT